MTTFPELPKVKMLGKNDTESDSVPELDFPMACRLLDSYIDFMLSKLDYVRTVKKPLNLYAIEIGRKELMSRPDFFTIIIPFFKHISEMQLLVNKSHSIYERGNLTFWEKMEFGLKLERAEEILQSARTKLKEFEPYFPELLKTSEEK